MPQFERRFLMPAVDALSTCLWLTVLVVPPPVKYTSNGLRSTHGIIILAAIEWYVLEAGIIINVNSLSNCRVIPLGQQLLTSSDI
jgi:hypothetical protein